MSERTKLLKKAVMTSVGATSNIDRIKTALTDAMEDLVKVGQNLMDDLEETGKVKTESVQDFLKHLQTEASKRSAEVEKKVSSKVQVGVKKAAQEFGLITHEDFDEICERLRDIELHLGMETETGEDGEHTSGKRGRRKKSHHAN